MRLIAIIWVALTVVINVFALTGMLYEFGWASTAWQAPFSTFGHIYAQIADPVYNATRNMLDTQFEFELPKWVMHAVIAYAASASAIAASGLGITSRDGFMDSIKSSGLSVAWPVGIAYLIWKGFRLQIVSKFAKDHSKILLAYVAAVVVVYFGAVFVNNNVLEGEATVIEAPVTDVVEEEASPDTE